MYVLYTNTARDSKGEKQHCVGIRINCIVERMKSKHGKTIISKIANKHSKHSKQFHHPTLLCESVRVNDRHKCRRHFAEGGTLNCEGKTPDCRVKKLNCEGKTLNCEANTLDGKHKIMIVRVTGANVGVVQ